MPSYRTDTTTIWWCRRRINEQIQRACDDAVVSNRYNDHLMMSSYRCIHWVYAHLPSVWYHIIGGQDKYTQSQKASVSTVWVRYWSTCPSGHVASEVLIPSDHHMYGTVACIDVTWALQTAHLLTHRSQLAIPSIAPPTGSRSLWRAVACGTVLYAIYPI